MLGRLRILTTIIIRKKKARKRDVKQFEDLLKPHTEFSYREFLRWEIDLDGLRQAWGNIKKVKHSAKRHRYLQNNLSASLQRFFIYSYWSQRKYTWVRATITL